MMVGGIGEMVKSIRKKVFKGAIGRLGQEIRFTIGKMLDKGKVEIDSQVWTNQVNTIIEGFIT
jgi:hypothetical protein